jgi:hypothetical protein
MVMLLVVVKGTFQSMSEQSDAVSQTRRKYPRIVEGPAGGKFFVCISREPRGMICRLVGMNSFRLID